MIVVAGSTSRYPPRCWLAADRRRRRRSSLPSRPNSGRPCSPLPLPSVPTPSPSTPLSIPTHGKGRITAVRQALIELWPWSASLFPARFRPPFGSPPLPLGSLVPARLMLIITVVCRIAAGVVGPNGWSDWVVWTWLKPLALFIDPTRTGLTRSFFDGFLSFMHGFWPFSNGSMYNWLSSTLYIWMTSN